MAQRDATTAYATQNGIATITIDHPPVNALGHTVRQGIMAGLNAALADDTVQAIVISSLGRMFSAGADITEFGAPMPSPDLGELIDAFDASPKPIIAGLFGTTLGGGLELALSCHYRVATADARLGLPEVKLGILPGAGGTQRLPRLIGPEKALAMILSGDADRGGYRAGRRDDRRHRGDPIAGAIAFARQIIAEGGPTPRVRDREDHIAATRKDPAAFEAAAEAASKNAPAPSPPPPASPRCATPSPCPSTTASPPSAHFSPNWSMGEQSRAQRHLFFAEREAARLPDAPPGIQPAAITRAVVIGGGTMGGGIAMCFANAGLPVTLIETLGGISRQKPGAHQNHYQASLTRGTLDAEAMARRISLITGAPDWEAVANADIVIEAVFENLTLKQEIFAKLDPLAKPGALLATNTSALDLDAIANATSRPGDVVGMHFFSPANVMKLLEIVRGAKTSDQAIATAIAAGRKLGKIPVVVGNGDGFVGNRMLARRTAEAERLLLEGALPQDVDAIVQAFGFPMGPYAMADLAGLDVGRRIREHRGDIAPVSDALCALGRFGQKTGAGYFIYQNGARVPVPDPRVAALAEKTAEALGITRREISEQEILERMSLSADQRGSTPPRRRHRPPRLGYRRDLGPWLWLARLAGRPMLLRGPDRRAKNLRRARPLRRPHRRSPARPRPLAAQPRGEGRAFRGFQSARLTPAAAGSAPRIRLVTTCSDP